MEKLELYPPALEELAFREKCLGDPETMSYNCAYGGTVAFPRERWANWYARWMEDGTGAYYYRYLRVKASGEFVGYISYHFDEEFGEYMCEVIVTAQHRGRGFGRQGLELLCAAAKENGVKRLVDDIAIDNPSVTMFLRCGFREKMRADAFVLVEKDL